MLAVLPLSTQTLEARCFQQLYRCHVPSINLVNLRSCSDVSPSIVGKYTWTLLLCACGSFGSGLEALANRQRFGRVLLSSPGSRGYASSRFEAN